MQKLFCHFDVKTIMIIDDHIKELVIYGRYG